MSLVGGHPDRLQRQRFELKYIIDEQLALGIRDFVQSYLEIDEYGATQPNLSYSVHSLYLDSPDLKLYHATINGEKNRYKLRLRFYENRPNAPVYCEIKRRMNNTISKERAGIVREAVSDLLAGFLPESGQIFHPSPKQQVAVAHFCQLASDLQARPQTRVAYLREAWISRHDNSVRVTLDRDVRTDTSPGTNLTTEMTHPVRVFGEKVVLELKFTGRFPDWFKDLVRVFGLTQCGAAKYADGITRLGNQRVAHAFALDGYYAAAHERLDRIDHVGGSQGRSGLPNPQTLRSLV